MEDRKEKIRYEEEMQNYIQYTKWYHGIYDSFTQ